jgi:hypothetical protein
MRIENRGLPWQYGILTKVSCWLAFVAGLFNFDAVSHQYFVASLPSKRRAEESRPAGEIS